MRAAMIGLAMLALTGCGAGTVAHAAPPTPVPVVAPTATALPAPIPTVTPSGAVAAIDALTQQTATACGETVGQIGQSVVIIRDQLATKGVAYPDGASFQGFAASTLTSVLRLHQSTGMTCPQAFVAVMDQTLQAAGAE